MEPTVRAGYERKMLATPELVAETKIVERLGTRHLAGIAKSMEEQADGD